ncbi:MAG TPA: twin-arginine translocation signal domain-containing protein, partial [Candidatus Mailhella merdavium]|nr:twin-arginine translocation signal domain-containing protein [Candidatus Mailhella merdavium]
MATGFENKTSFDIVKGSPMRRRDFLKQAGVTAVAAATVGLGRLSCAESVLANIPLRTYKLGRLSVTVPEFMRPQVEKFSYTWDSRTPDGKDYSLAYPIKVYEYPFESTPANAKQEWENSVSGEITRYKKSDDLYFDWDVSSKFNTHAHFICYDEGRHYNFHIVILEKSNIMHIVGLNSYWYPDTPEKDNTTNKIIHILADFYKKYCYGHNSHHENVFHTYYGEMINNTFNYDERMSIFFADIEDRYRLRISTDTNPKSKSESHIEKRMKKLRGFGIYSRSKMSKIPYFPGKGWESLKKDDDNMAFYSFNYNGPGRNAFIPSLTMGAGKSP